MSLILLLPQLLMVVWIMPGSTYGYIGCTAVSAAGETTVICLFENDISQKGFSVHRYHTPGSVGEMVLACNRQSSGGLVCDKNRETKFDTNQTVTNQLILTRTTSKNTPGMQYLCEVVPSEKDIVQRCSVFYKAVSTTPSATTTKANTYSQGMDDSYPLLVVLLVLFILSIIAVIIICVTCYIMRKSCLYNRIRKRWFSTINESWPGAIGDPEEPPSRNTSSIEQSSSTAASSRDIPKGLPDHFYKLGLEDAMKEEERKRAAHEKEHREKEQQNQDKAQSEAGPKQGGSTGFRFSIRAGKGPKQDARKEQKNTKDKGDPDREANLMESASTGDPMLHPPQYSMAEGRQYSVPSGAAAHKHVEDVFLDDISEEPSQNEEPPEQRPERKKNKGILGQLKAGERRGRPTAERSQC